MSAPVYMSGERLFDETPISDTMKPSPMIAKVMNRQVSGLIFFITTPPILDVYILTGKKVFVI